MGFENLENQMESQKMGFSGSISEGKIAEAQVHDNISDDDEVIDFIDLVTGAVSYFPLTVVQICGVFFSRGMCYQSRSLTIVFHS